MRHSRASTTQDVYQQVVPESQRKAVQKLTAFVKTVVKRGCRSAIMWSKCNQLQPNSEKQVCKLLKMVARDGIEPPTPAFSGLLTDNAKWFRISAGDQLEKELRESDFRTDWDHLGCFRPADVPLLFPPSGACGLSERFVGARP